MERRKKGKDIEWNEQAIKKITDALALEGLYKPESTPMIPRLHIPGGALKSWERAFDPIFLEDQQAPWDQVFRDEAKESADWLLASYPGFLHDGPTAELLRRRPNNLRESIARDLCESGALEHFPTKFRITAFLISRGITEEGDPEKEAFFPQYSWRDFLHYQPKVDRMIRSAKRCYFQKKAFISSAVGETIWERFDRAFERLSIKQRTALEIHIMSDEPLSLEAGAKRLKISKASFRDRVQSAIRLIEKALPELVAVKPPKVRKSPKKKSPSSSIVIPRKDAPAAGELKAWLDKTCEEPRWVDWDGIFKAPKPRRNGNL